MLMHLMYFRVYYYNLLLSLLNLYSLFDLLTPGALLETAAKRKKTEPKSSNPEEKSEGNHDW